MNYYARLETLGLSETLEGLSERFGLPDCPRYELSAFAALWRPELDAALDAQDLAVARRPSAAAYARRGRLRRAAQDRGGALDDFQKALDLEPGLAAAHAGLGEADLSRPEAEESLSRALALDARAVWPRLYRGAARLLAGRGRQAREDLAEFTRRKPGSALGWLLLGACEQKLSRRPAAARAYERAWSADRSCAAAALQRARLAVHGAERRRWLDRAAEPAAAAATLAELSSAIAGAPWSGALRARRGELLRSLGKTAAALKDLDAASRLQPHWTRSFFWRGRLLRELGRFADALRDLDRALPFHAGEAEAWHERALARRSLGDLIGAAFDMDRAFLLDASCRWVGDGARPPAPEELKRAERELTAALKRSPSVASLWVWRGQARLQASDRSGAMLDFERAAELDPHFAVAHAWAARALLDCGRHAAAAERARRALALEPRLKIVRRWLDDAGTAGSSAGQPESTGLGVGAPAGQGRAGLRGSAGALRRPRASPGNRPLAAERVGENSADPSGA